MRLGAYKIEEAISRKTLTEYNLPMILRGRVNSVPASGEFCRLLISFANSLDLDLARHYVGPDLDPKCLTLWWYSRKIFFFLNKKVN